MITLLFFIAALMFLTSAIVGYVRHDMIDLQDIGWFFLTVALYLILVQ